MFLVAYVLGSAAHGGCTFDATLDDLAELISSAEAAYVTWDRDDLDRAQLRTNAITVASVALGVLAAGPLGLALGAAP